MVPVLVHYLHFVRAPTFIIHFAIGKGRALHFTAFRMRRRGSFILLLEKKKSIQILDHSCFHNFYLFFFIQMDD